MLRSVKLSRSFFSSSWFYPACSGALLALAFAHPRLGFCAFIGLIPLLRALEVCAGNIRDTAVSGYCYGLVFSLMLFYWLTNVSVLGYILLSMAVACYYAFFAALTFGFAKKESDFSTIMFLFRIASAWTIMEWAKAHLFSGLSWGNIAYTQYKNLWFIQTADIGGSYIVSFMIVALNGLLYKFLTQPYRRNYVVAGGIILAVNLTYGWYKVSAHKPGPQTPSIRLALLQGNIPLDFSWQEHYWPIILKRYETLSFNAAEQNPDMIIWPETAMPSTIDKPETRWLIGNILKETNTKLLIGMPRHDKKEKAAHNSVYFFENSSDETDYYDKVHLVPFGEYIPFDGAFKELTRFLMPIEIDDYSGGKSAQIFTSGRMKFAPLICFEDTKENYVASISKAGVDFFVVITNDAWFGDTTAPYQHLAFSVFRAVESRAPVVRAANTGITAAIDSRGYIQNIFADRDGRNTFTSGYLVADVPCRAPSSAQAATGGKLFIGLCFAMLLPAAWLRRRLLI